MASSAELQQRAVEFARAGDFGQRALETNLELTRLAPVNEGAWTRLARCYLETGQLDEATAALESALRVNPQNTIARNLLAEVSKRRVAAAAPATAPRRRARRTTRAEPAAPAGGFGRPEFAALGQLPPAAAVESLSPRIESILMALNERPFAQKAVETRNRAGRPGARLYRRNSIYPGSAGHLFAFQHGGRWEPQLNIGFFAASHWERHCIRAGIGFDLTAAGADPDRQSGQERALESFAHFQRLVATEWRDILTDWMSRQGGFIQYRDRPPATDLVPRDAVAWLANCQAAAETGWIFLGGWLFADRTPDVETMYDGRRLTGWFDDTFSALLPLWASLFRAP
jgi:Tetratricopeptide repeat